MFYTINTPWISKKIYPKAMWSANPQEKSVYLTFDDGPTEQLTYWILDLLHEYQAKATFFCIGKQVEAFKEQYQAIINEGHTVGNHTQTHPNGWHTKTANFLKDVDEAKTLIDSNLFRPPYGAMRWGQYKALSKKYKIVMWSIMNGDFLAKTSKEECVSRITKNVRSGSLIVMHDKDRIEAKLKWYLPKVLQFLQDEGYEMKAL